MPTPFLSEIKYRGPGNQDFVEVVLDEGADASLVSLVVYNPNGTVRSTNGLGSLVDTIAGKDVYVVNAAVHKNGAVALVEDGVVISFVSFDSVVTPGSGPAAGMTSTQIGSTGNNQNASLVSSDGSSYSTQTPPDSGTIPCFLRGTRIATPGGERPVEELVPGDMVCLQDGGAAPLRWIGRATVDVDGAPSAAHAPVCIPRGAMGRGVPRRDLFVSPNHRVSMNSPSYELWFGETDVLIPAKHLIGWNGISTVADIARPEYFHLLFDSHQIILSEGLPTESFHPSGLVFDMFSEATRRELLEFFPGLRNRIDPGQVTAQTCLKGFEATIALDLVSNG